MKKQIHLLRVKHLRLVLKLLFPVSLISNVSVSLIIEDLKGKQITSTEVEIVNSQKGTYKFEFFEKIIKYNWGDYFLSIIIHSKENSLVEFNQISRISFKNKYIKNEVHYGGYLLNQMEAKVNKIH